VTVDIKKIHMEHFKTRLYNMWRGKLMKDFKFWHEGGHHKVRHKKMLVVNEMESQNQAIEDNL
jgi:hypothetical protein